MKTELSLAGTWTLRESEVADTIPVEVPGDVHSALLAAGRIPDPYWGDNEKRVQWVGEREWVYERDFEAGDELLNRRSVILEVEHPDTFCEILINGSPAGSTANRFRRYQFDVKPLLRAGRNTITAVFRSSEKIALERGKALAHPIRCDYHEDGIGQAKPHYNLIRKPQCHVGWDWGICLMQIGFPGVVRLIGTDDARIDYAWCDQRHEDGRCSVTVTVEAFAPVAGRVELAATLGAATTRQQVELSEGINRVSASLVIENPRLWWPNGMGEPFLHDLEIRLGDGTLRRKIGLRTVELVRQPDEWGTSMMFRVNGTDIFVKGTNWIPADALSARQTPERIGNLLASAQAAHMNMVRLWGGGQFESDFFYDECDRRGLLLWHDFMFACALYPGDNEFLAEVRAEVEHQIKRLRDHACLALWCGDNECFSFPEATRESALSVINYDRLSRTLGDAVEELDPGRTFWPSSPLLKPGSYGEWTGDKEGDMHFWDVWHKSQDFESYHTIRPRFCSEFGFQSFSSPEVARRFCPEDQINPTAPLFEHHQKNIGGNSRILETMTRYFRMPAGVEHTLWLSQLQQALAIKTAIESWRRHRPRCMGSIIWQLNDTWPVASWSSIEHGGKWKQLHYHARRFYAPVAVVAIQETAKSEEVELWAVNDHMEPADATVAVEAWTFDGTLVETIPLAATLEAGSAHHLGTFPIDRFCPAAGDRSRRFLNLELAAKVGAVTERHRNQHFFARYKTCELAGASVSANVTGLPGGDLGVHLESSHPALWVWVNAAEIGGEFDDNSIALLPGRPVDLIFKPEAPISPGQLSAALSVTHLRQTY